jgi:hypothetical protein
MPLAPRLAVLALRALAAGARAQEPVVAALDQPALLASAEPALKD